MSERWRAAVAMGVAMAGIAAACGESGQSGQASAGSSGQASGGASGGPSEAGTAGSGGGVVIDASLDAQGGCSAACAPGEACLDGACVNACVAAEQTKASVGCDYYAVYMDMDADNLNHCFAVIVANAGAQNAQLQVDYAGEPIDVATYAKRPAGSGLGLSYEPFDDSVGLPPGEVAILFLADDPLPDDPNGYFQCPVPAARGSEAFFSGTGLGNAFRIRSNVPVVAYQMLPFGGGSAAVTGASLLIPTSAWDRNYVAVNAYAAWNDGVGDYSPSLNIVAAEDATTVTMLPKAAITAGTGVPAAAAATPVSFTLDAGQMLQITQTVELTGSPIEADKPIGFWAGHRAMRVPTDAPYADHAEQQIPPVRALGHEYAAVSYRQRTEVAEQPRYRLIGAVDGTALTFDPPVAGAPATIDLGGVAEFVATDPFVVKSQDADHPFLLVTYMTGASTVGTGGFLLASYGDADFVRIVPPAQYMNRYVFFTDPTYPETNLVVIRKQGASGFADVTLDCAGTLSGWQALGGSSVYEYTRIDLVRHQWEPQGNCDNGPHEMSSSEPFGLWVWGWGSWETDSAPGDGYKYTQAVSYGYPAGENIASINSVVVPVVVK